LLRRLVLLSAEGIKPGKRQSRDHRQ
jgi:hypothetical protein